MCSSDLLAIFWGINGWAQSMGVGPCAVSLARWYGVKERGTFYGIWSTAHNIGEAVTYMVIAAVIAGFGWQMGYLSTAALGAAGVVLLVLFMHDSPQGPAPGVPQPVRRLLDRAGAAAPPGKGGGGDAALSAAAVGTLRRV